MSLSNLGGSKEKAAITGKLAKTGDLILPAGHGSHEPPASGLAADRSNVRSGHEALDEALGADYGQVPWREPVKSSGLKLKNSLPAQQRGTDGQPMTGPENPATEGQKQNTGSLHGRWGEITTSQGSGTWMPGGGSWGP